MCLLNFVLFFKINYKCAYGESVYIVGNTDVLGNWNPARALQLDWSDGHNWICKLKIMHDNTKKIEYKYLVAPTDPSKPLTKQRWELGPNRVIDLFTVSKLLIKLNDEWEHVKIKLALRDDAIKEHLKDSEKRVMLFTNLDIPKSSVEMKLKKYALEAGHKEDWFWMATLYVPNSVDAFNYKYRIMGKPGEEVIGDRSNRKYKLKKSTNSFSNNEYYAIKCSTKMKFDFYFSTNLSYSEVTEDMLVGAFPQNLKDVTDLAGLEVKGVLNLQTFGDMARFGENWDQLMNFYEKYNIAVEHFPIVDMDPVDLKSKIEDAASRLDKLLKLGKVYVHCTAGKHRSPQVIMHYLHNYKDFSLKQAVSLVKSKRLNAKIFDGVLLDKRRKSLSTISEEKYIDYNLVDKEAVREAK